MEKPCEVNAGNCSFDSECRGNLICTQNDCKGSTFSLYSKCCQEPGDDIFYISTWFTNYYKMVDILFYYFLLYIVPKKTSFKECCFIYLEFSVSIELWIGFFKAREKTFWAQTIECPEVRKSLYLQLPSTYLILT